MKREFVLQSDYIELIKFLKLLGIAETGGMAKNMVEEGEVSVNGIKETRRRYKLKSGDVVEVLGNAIHIIK